MSHLPALRIGAEQYEYRQSISHAPGLARGGTRDGSTATSKSVAGGSAPYSTSMDDLLDDKNVDVVAICSPHQARRAGDHTPAAPGDPEGVL